MTDLDELLSAHVRDLTPATRPPLTALRRRAVRRRQLAAGGLLTVTATAVVLALGAGQWARGPDTTRTASGDLTPTQPSAPNLGVLAGRVQEVPEPQQRSVTLRFTGLGNMSHKSVDVSTRQGGTWQVELNAGIWRITALEGGGVCQSTATVVAGAWQRHDIGWPCDEPAAPPDPIGAPSFSGTVNVSVGERVRTTLNARCGIGPIQVDGALFYTDTYAAPGTNPPGWKQIESGWATRPDLNTVRFLADDSGIRITFRRDLNARPPVLCPAN